MTTFTAYTVESAPPEAQKILTNIKAGYGFVPNLFPIWRKLRSPSKPT